MTIKKIGFIAEGTTCKACEEIIKRQAMKVDGVIEASFDYAEETGHVTFDSEKTDIDTILYKIEEKNYKCFILNEESKAARAKKNAKRSLFGWIFGLIGLVLVYYFAVYIYEGVAMPTISQGMGYGLLFAVGLLTGFHCIGMCGGFVVSYSANDAKEGRSSHGSHIKYGLGKTISYTIIGAVFGLIGSLIAFTPMMRGVAGILAGIFLVLFGVKMLNIFPALRKIHIRTPKFITRFLGKQHNKNSGPFVIGLLNGLMIACGPLQAIYIMAAGTGSMIEGAKLLLVFGLGTLPVMLGFGYFASYLSHKSTQKILKASGVIVIVLGIIMLNRGLALTGTGYDANTLLASVSAADSENIRDMATLNNDYQIIRMDVTRSGWSPDKFVLQKGVPVKWIINGKEITGCNNAINVPKLGLEFDIKPGEQTIEFTPTESGTIPWSCWMGMIPGTFIVKDNVDLGNAQQVQKELDAVPVQQAGSCGGSTGGGCGCGG